MSGSSSPVRLLESTSAFLPPDASLFADDGASEQPDFRDGAVDSLLHDLQMLHYSYSPRNSASQQQSPSDHAPRTSTAWIPVQQAPGLEYYQHSPPTSFQQQESTFCHPDGNVMYHSPPPPPQPPPPQMAYIIPAQAGWQPPMLISSPSPGHHPLTSPQLITSPRHQSAAFRAPAPTAPAPFQKEHSQKVLSASVSRQLTPNQSTRARSTSNLPDSFYNTPHSRRNTGSRRSTKESSSIPTGWQLQNTPSQRTLQQAASSLRVLSAQHQQQPRASTNDPQEPPASSPASRPRTAHRQQLMTIPSGHSIGQQLIISNATLQDDDAYDSAEDGNDVEMPSPASRQRMADDDRASQQQVAQLEQLLQQLQQEKGELEQQLLQSQASLAAALQRRRSVEDKEEQLKEAAAEAERQAKSTQKDLQLAHKQLDAKLQELKQCQEQLEAERAAHLTTKHSLSAAKDNIADLQKQLSTVDKKLHTTAEECRRLDAEVMALRRDAAGLNDASQRARQELSDGREKLRASQMEAQRRCQQAEAERAALAEQLAALREHVKGVERSGAAAQQDAQMAFEDNRRLRAELDAARQELEQQRAANGSLAAQAAAFRQEVEQQRSAHSSLAAQSAAVRQELEQQRAALVAARDELRASSELQHSSYSFQQQQQQQQQQPWQASSQQYSGPSAYQQQQQYQPQGASSYLAPPRSASPTYNPTPAAYSDARQYNSSSKPYESYSMASPQMIPRSYSNSGAQGAAAAADVLLLRGSRAFSDPQAGYPGASDAAGTSAYHSKPPPYQSSSYYRPASPVQQQQQQQYHGALVPAAQPSYGPLSPENSERYYSGRQQQQQQQQRMPQAESSARYVGISAEPSSRSVVDHYSQQQQQQQPYGMAMSSSDSTPASNSSPAGKEQSPFGTDYTLQDMLGRTKHLEEQLMQQCQEKAALEAEYAKMPPHGGRTLRERQRKCEVERRMEELSRAVSTTRLQLKKLLGK